MADPRPSHHTVPAHMRQSLLNTPTPPYEGPARSLYGSRGPVQAANAGRQRRPLSGQPESVPHFVDDALARVADLTGRQRNAVRAEVLRMLNDITFLRQLTNEARARGPWSAEAVQPSDEGRVL
jgi:hypothetical protein